MPPTKWLFLITILNICCSSSFGTKVPEENLMLAIKKINNDNFNLTCLAHGRYTHEGFSLTGPEVNENSENNNRALYEYIQLSETLLHLDLPPVFDEEWIGFPIYEPSRAITIHSNEYLWISVRYKEGLIIQNENNVSRSKIICKEYRRWIHLQLQFHSTHLSIKSDKCSFENSFVYSNDANIRLLHLNSFYKEHRYNVKMITENMNSIYTQGKEKRKFEFKIQKLYSHHIRLSYSLKCSSCNAIIRFETVTDNAGEQSGKISLAPQNNFTWNTAELNVNETVPIGSAIDVVVIVVSEPHTELTLVIRNLFFHEESIGQSISTLVNSADISKYICESMESNLSTIPGSVKFNNTKKELRFPQSKLCYSDGNCYCSSGSHGDMCEQSCKDGYWGDCSIECDCCKMGNICNKVDGSCGIEEDCQKFRSVESVMLNSSSTSIMGNIKIQIKIVQKKINSIKIDYRMAQEDNWIMFKYEENLNNRFFNITNLKPNTNYSTRTSLCVDHICFDEYGYISSITTLCDKPVSSELNLEIGIDLVTLNHSNYSSKEGSCAQFLTISSNKKKSEHELRGLIPYTNYAIQIMFQGEIIDTRVIHTKTAKASKVRSLNFKESQGLLSWSEPEYPYGNLGHYFVNITRLGSILCDDITINQYETENLQLPIKVIPYSRYEVIVHASNEEGRGHAAKIIFQSSSTNVFEDIEKPTKFVINETHLDIEIHGCRYISGPWLRYESTFTCLNPECENAQITSNVKLIYSQESKYILSLEKSLDPYTNYKVQTSIYRDKDVKTISIYTGNIKTRPHCPPPVRHLDVYSVSNSSISVRWKLPHPLRGVLEKILFKFQPAGLRTKKVEIHNMRKCSLWDETDYFCETLEDINDQSFPIYVIGKNFNTTNCKENDTINNVALHESSSEAPIDLKANWKGDMDELELTWKHPNKSNGYLKNFIVSLKSTTDESKDILDVFNISNESHHYTYSIKSFNKSTKYKVEVIPVNAVRGSPAKLKHEIITPPPYPVIDNNTTYSIHGNNFRVDIPSIRNASRNTTIMVIISNGNCQYTADTNAIIGRIDVETETDVFNQTIKIDLVKEFNITNISIINDYSVAVIVVNTFEGISRNASRCLTQTTINLASTFSGHKYIWISLISLLLLLSIVCTVISYKYKVFKCPRNNINIFRGRKRNDSFSSSRMEPYDNEYIELKRGYKVSYENQPLIPKSNVIQTKKILKYLKLAVRYGEECELYTDFDSIPLKISNFSEIAIKNKIKNRYLNILPYEENRVILESGTYVNASFIQGYKTERAYIATQGPKLQTVNDFWEMVYEYNVSLIAMLCPLKENDKVKCDQYWPDFRNKILNSKNLQIEFDSENNFGVYIERSFTLICDTGQRKIVQLQFTAWMDHNIPRSSQFLYEFLERFNELHDYSNPAIVHCSAGSGRTGTLILCDYLLKMEKDTSTLDFPLVLCNLRKERTQMVQTKQQYHFAHVVIYELLCIGKNHIACDENFEKNILKVIQTKEKIQKQIKSLESLYAVDVSTFDDKIVSMEAEDIVKNRDEHILPTYSGIIYLQPTKRSPSTYINAINVDGYEQSEKFVVTQQPLISSQGSTVVDFWRLVFQTQPEVIVSLEEQVINFYPTKGELLINNFIKLKCVKQTQDQSSTTFTIKAIMGNEDFIVKIMTPNTQMEATVDGLAEFLNFYNEYRSIYSNKEFIVLVTCLNGCDLSGVFVALDYTIEKMLQQAICDVFLAVRTVKKTRPNFISTEEQFRFLYRCALEMRKAMCSVYHNTTHRLRD